MTSSTVVTASLLLVSVIAILLAIIAKEQHISEFLNNFSILMVMLLIADMAHRYLINPAPSNTDEDEIEEEPEAEPDEYNPPGETFDLDEEDKAWLTKQQHSATATMGRIRGHVTINSSSLYIHDGDVHHDFANEMPSNGSEGDAAKAVAFRWRIPAIYIGRLNATCCCERCRAYQQSLGLAIVPLPEDCYDGRTQPEPVDPDAMPSNGEVADTLAATQFRWGLDNFTSGSRWYRPVCDCSHCRAFARYMF